MIQLQNSITIQQAITSSEVSVDEFKDNPNTKTVHVRLNIGKNAAGEAVYKEYLLWGPDDYDTCGAAGNGQWTASDAEERIIELLNQ